LKEKKNQNKNAFLNNGIPKISNYKYLDRKLSSQNSIYGNEEENENKNNGECSEPRKIKLNYNNENRYIERQKSRLRLDSSYALNLYNNNFKILTLSKRNFKKINEQREVNINKSYTNIKDGNIQTNETIISKIKIKRASIYCCFLFTRKRKTVENVLLDESMKFIKEKLDIFNIFDKVYKSEKFQEKIIKQDIFEMSAECKKKLLSINNK
jgi:hypothetical protein